MAKVLVIEDDPAQREIYSKLLYYNGFDVEIAGDAESGIRSALELEPDVLLMDVMLPGISGIEAASLLKSNPRTADIPVVFMSGYDIDVNQVRRAGGRGYLRKPVRGDVLVRSIRDLIGWDEGKD